MAETWRFIDSGPTEPALNMGIDMALLDSAVCEPTLRFYEWWPYAVSLGYFQPADELDIGGLRERGWSVVRRVTGGGAIFHERELTFSLACGRGSTVVPRNVRDAYDVVHAPIIRTLRELGLDGADMRGDGSALSDSAGRTAMCFERSTAFDVVWQGRKVVGSAQKRSKDGILQHGSIPVAPNELAPESGWVDLDSAGLDMAGFKAALRDAFASEFGIELVDGELTTVEKETAEKYAREKFSSRDWLLKR